MKKLILLAAIFLSAWVAKAQAPMFTKGDNHLNIGIGIFHDPVVVANIDYCIADGIIDYGSFGVGPYVGLELAGSSSFKFGGRGTFHYPLFDDFDTYIGMGLGFEYNDNELDQLHADAAFIFGVNYPVKKNLVLFGEVGSGLSFLSAGITLSL